MNTRILIDGRNIYSPEEAITAGFDYSGVGRAVRNRNGRSVEGKASA